LCVRSRVWMNPTWEKPVKRKHHLFTTGSLRLGHAEKKRLGAMIDCQKAFRGRHGEKKSRGSGPDCQTEEDSRLRQTRKPVRPGGQTLFSDAGSPAASWPCSHRQGGIGGKLVSKGPWKEKYLSLVLELSGAGENPKKCGA